MKKTKVVESYKDTAAKQGRATRVTEKSGFYDHLKVTEQNPKEQPKDGINSPWDFTCPQYDQRSGNFIDAGAHFGVGRRVPVGHKDGAKQTVPCLPQTRRNTMQDDDLG
jgi:hypothetical protein